MALSPNYGWSEPDNSSLVKNGAADIRTLGDSIDTSVWNVGYGQAGKNKIINGDFRINQRSFTSNTTGGAYNFDRWVQNNGGTTGTLTITPQTFTLGAAPVTGYEGTNFVQCITAAGANVDTFASFSQRIEDVRSFVSQTATISFWAKAGTGTPKVAVEIAQNFGTGGSPSATVNTPAGAVTISTSWARYSLTIAVPSISGKTLGSNNNSYTSINLWLSAGSDFNTRASSIGLQNATFQFWGVQLEYGSKATPFQTATGTIQGELAACQRYYWRLTGNAAGYYRLTDSGFANSTTDAQLSIQNPVTMRVTPTSVDYAGVFLENYIGAGSKAVTALTINNVSNPQVSTAGITVASGLTAGTRYFGFLNNNTSSFIGYSAEL